PWTRTLAARTTVASRPVARPSVVVVVATADRQMTARVDELFQLLADLEEREPLGWDGHGLPRPLVPAVVWLVRADAEAPIPADFNAFPLLERLGHCLEDAIDD